MRSALLWAVALVACGGKSKPVQLAPLPEDPKPAAAEAPAATPAPAAEEAPAAPAGPLEVTVAPSQTTVKLVAKGRGKLAPLRYTPAAGGKQPIELALDFSSLETAGTEQQATQIPTIVLRGEAETKAVAADGRADYAIAVAATDAREVQGARIAPDQMKQMVASLATMVITGSHAPNGAAGELKLRVEKPDQLTPGALEIVRLALPVLPVLPAEPVGVGAKWQTTTEAKLAEKIVVKQVTDYELVAAKGTTWTIKGKTAVTGADQELNGGKISGIKGSGTSELTLAAGAAYPAYKSSLETSFTATADSQSMTLGLRVASAVGAPGAATPPAAPAAATPPATPPKK